MNTPYVCRLASIPISFAVATADRRKYQRTDRGLAVACALRIRHGNGSTGL